MILSLFRRRSKLGACAPQRRSLLPRLILHGVLSCITSTSNFAKFPTCLISRERWQTAKLAYGKRAATGEKSHDFGRKASSVTKQTYRDSRSYAHQHDHLCLCTIQRVLTAAKLALVQKPKVYSWEYSSSSQYRTLILQAHGNPPYYASPLRWASRYAWTLKGASPGAGCRRR